MTLAELELAALNAIATRKRMRAEMGDPVTGYPFNSPAQLQLVLKRPEPRGNRVRLAGRRGPIGEFIASPADGEVLAAFDADAVLRWARVQIAAGAA